MKRIISLLLILVMISSTYIPSFATDRGEEYYSIPVEYSDNIGHREQLRVMIKDNSVYVDAKMLAERFGYTFGDKDDSLAISNTNKLNDLPQCVVVFYYNTTRVSRMMLYRMIDNYEAPFVSIKNEEGSWIPLEYALLLLNSGMMITDGALLIDIPTKRIIDYYYDILKNSNKYHFDWADDFGYTGADVNVITGSSHIANLFSGLLDFDSASWKALFQQFVGSMEAYDQKYGEDLAMLLCTESDKELQATIDRTEMLIDLLSDDGSLGEILSTTSMTIDSQVGTIYKECERILQNVKNNNSPLVTYNKSYQALEDALDRQTWFSNTGENILEVQKGVSSAGNVFTYLDIGTKVLEVVGFMKEFQNQDKFSLDALQYYLKSERGGVDLPKAMKESMNEYSDTLSSNIAEYTTKRFVDNVDQWIIDEVPITEVLGTQAAIVLFAWNIASNIIPFVSNGLSGTDNFELALYSYVFQNDARMNYQDRQTELFAKDESITAENIYDLTQYCYVYLKSCYITREAALASLDNKRSSTKEKIQPLIDYQNSINDEIAKIMVEFKNTNKENKGYVFGFLPSDNQAYLKQYNDGWVISWLKEKGQSSGEHSGESGSIYSAVISELENEYGPLTLKTYDDPNPQFEDGTEKISEVNGLCYLSLIDFNNDGIKELVAVAKHEIDPEYTVMVYTIEKDQAVQLVSSTKLTDADWYADYLCLLSDENSHTYIDRNQSGGEWDYDEIYGYEDGEFKLISISCRKYNFEKGGWDNYLVEEVPDVVEDQKLNRRLVSQEEYEKKASLATGASNTEYSFICFRIPDTDIEVGNYYGFDLNALRDSIDQVKAELDGTEQKTNDVPVPDSHEDSNGAWKQAYIDYIETDSDITFNPDWCTFGLIYLDNDDIPELIIEYSSEADGTGIISFKNGNTVSHRFSRTGGVKYIEHEGLVHNSIGVQGSFVDEFALLDDEGFHDYGHGYRYGESQDFTNFTHFVWNEKEISEEEYMANIDKFDNGQLKNWNSYSEEFMDNNYSYYEMQAYLMNN